MEPVETIASFISREILKDPTRKLSIGDPLISSGLIDSFSLVDLALFIEDQFDVRIEDTELNVETFDSLGELSALVEQRTGPGS